MDEQTTGTPGARGAFEMVPSDVFGTSKTYAGAADELPNTIAGAVNAALLMITATPASPPRPRCGRSSPVTTRRRSAACAPRPTTAPSC
ncbi:hypothetical protein [Phytohabitans flavus]|uniref:hypothetical protein n=1 Tax=Phytohabitans flavus TaxID=1076124 RepID=UPI00156616E2|nr:hypothetical protein [Phytohabitans flavus]